jgi:hypothetical protein
VTICGLLTPLYARVIGQPTLAQWLAILVRLFALAARAAAAEEVPR